MGRVKPFSRAAVAVLAVCAATPAAADVDGFAILKASDLTRRDTPLNPDDVFNLPPGAGELGILVEGTVKTIRFRLRAEARGSLAGERIGGDWPRPPRAHVQELYVPVVRNNFLTVSLGKQVRSWDQGLSYLPLGFFRSTPDVTDPTDVEGRVSGLPMLVLTHVGAKLSVEVIVSDPIEGGNIASRLNQRQLAARFSGHILPAVEAALIVRARDRAQPGVGGSLSWARGSVELHGDLYFGQPEARLRRAPLFTAPAAFYPADPLALDNRRGFVANSVVGLTYSATRTLTLRGEWAHHGAGLDGRAWANYRANIAFHDTGRQAGDPRSTPSLGFDLAEFGSGGLRRDYAFVGATLDHNDLSASLFSLVGLTDASTTTTLAVTYKLDKSFDVAVQATAFTGPRTSEFGLSPYKQIVSLRAIRRF